MTDQELLELINDHDEAALASLEARFRDECIGEAMEITGDQRAARDCFFDALISFWSGRTKGNNAISDVGEIGELLKSSAKERAMLRMGLAPVSEASSTAPPVSMRDMADPDADDTPEESDNNAAEIDNGNGAANNTNDPEAEKTAADTKKRNKIKWLIILTGCLVLTGIITALIIGIASRKLRGPWNIDPVNTSSTKPGGDVAILEFTPGPYVSGIAINNVNVKLPDTLKQMMMRMYASSVLWGPDETDLMRNEALSAVNYINNSWSGGTLLIGETDNGEENADAEFYLITGMEVPVYDFSMTSAIGDWITLRVNVAYSGTVKRTYIESDKITLIECVPSYVSSVPFTSIQELFELNPGLSEMIKQILSGIGIDQINKDLPVRINSDISELPLRHITEAQFKYKTNSSSATLYKLTLSKDGESYELNYTFDTHGTLTECCVYTSAPGGTGAIVRPEVWDESYNPNYYINIPTSPGGSVVCYFKDDCLSRLELWQGNAGAGIGLLWEKNGVASVKYKDTTWGNGDKVCERRANYESTETIRTVNGSGVIMRNDRYENGLRMHSELLVPETTASTNYTGHSSFTLFERSKKGGIYETVYRCSGTLSSYRVTDHMFEYDETTGEGQCEYYDAAGNVIASFPAVFENEVWIISPRKEWWDDQEFYLGTADPDALGVLITEDTFKKLYMCINPDQRARFVNMSPDLFTVSHDGRFSLYLVVTVNLPVSLLSSSNRSVNIQVRVTGRAIRNETYTARPVWALYPEQAEYVGLYGTGYGLLFNLYQNEDKSSFTDQAGKELAGTEDYFSFVDIMSKYLSGVVNTGEFNAGEGPWLYAAGHYSYIIIPTETEITTNLPPVDDYIAL